MKAIPWFRKTRLQRCSLDILITCDGGPIFTIKIVTKKSGALFVQYRPYIDREMDKGSIVRVAEVFFVDADLLCLCDPVIN